MRFFFTLTIPPTCWHKNRNCQTGYCGYARGNWVLNWIIFINNSGYICTEGTGTWRGVDIDGTRLAVGYRTCWRRVRVCNRVFTCEKLGHY